MRKRVKKSIVVLLSFLMIVTPFSSYAFAATDSNVILKLTPTILGTVGSTTKPASYLNDGDTSTQSFLNPNTSVTYTFSNEKDLSSFDVDKTSGVSDIKKITVTTYDSSGNLISTHLDNSISSIPLNDSKVKSIKFAATTSAVWINDITVMGSEPDITPPGNVTALNSSNITANSFDVSWTPPTDNDLNSFKVYLDGSLVNTVSSTIKSYSFTNLISDTSYTIKVASVDTSGNESTDSTITVKTLDNRPPANVTNLKSSNISGSSFDVSWTPPTDNDLNSFKVYLNGVLKGTTQQGTNSYSFKSLSGNSSYTVKVTSLDTSGNESIGSTITVSTLDTIPPANVINLNSNNVTDKTFGISWTPPTDNDLNSFKIYLDGVLQGNKPKGTNSFSFSNLTASTSYTVKVTSLDNTGNESSGSTITVKTDIPPDVIPPENVTDLTGTPTHKSITLTWTNPPDTDFAKVNVYQDGVYKESVTASQESKAFFDNLTPEAVYTFKVTSIDTTGNESSGSAITVKTLPVPEVTNLVGSPTWNSITLSWKTPTNSDFASVKIYKDGVYEKTVTSTGSASEVFENLDPDTSYTFKISSVDIAGDESKGSSVTVKTLPKPISKDISNVKIESDYNKVKISWDTPDDTYFHHVNIYRKVTHKMTALENFIGVEKAYADTTTDGFTPMFETNGTYWTDLTVSPSTDYEYKLTAVSTAGMETTGVIVNTSTKQEPKPVIQGATFTTQPNGDYKITWTAPQTGKINVFVGDSEYATAEANTGMYSIPMSDLKYDNLGNPKVKIQAVTDHGTEGDFVYNGSSNLPFSVYDVIQSGSGLLWIIAPFILLSLAFLLVPKLRRLLFSVFKSPPSKKEEIPERRTKTEGRENEGPKERERKIEQEAAAATERETRKTRTSRISELKVSPTQQRKRIERQQRTERKTRETKGTRKAEKQPRTKRQPRQAREPKERKRG